MGASAPTDHIERVLQRSLLIGSACFLFVMALVLISPVQHLLHHGPRIVHFAN